MAVLVPEWPCCPGPLVRSMSWQKPEAASYLSESRKRWKGLRFHRPVKDLKVLAPSRRIVHRSKPSAIGALVKLFRRAVVSRNTVTFSRHVTLMLLKSALTVPSSRPFWLNGFCLWPAIISSRYI